MLKQLERAIEEQNEKQLQSYFIDFFYQTKEIDKIFYPIIARVLSEKWHDQQEDIIALIWLKNLKDNKFIDPIMKIAQQREIFRPFDDEFESTLRKCVHALKTIGTEESNLAIEKLLETGNENVNYALENYK